MNKKIFGLVLKVSIPITLLSCSSGGQSTPSTNACSVEYWVSTSGDDQASGSEDAPFKTIQHAQQVIRNNQLRKVCAINVNIVGGTYQLTQALVFTPQDAGAAQAKITYQRAPTSTQPVIISGGLAVHDFNCNNDNKCQAVVAELPDDRLPRQFYVQGKRAIRARSNYGLGINENYTRVDNGYQQIIPQTLTNPELIEAVTVNQWKMMRCPVQSLSGTRLIMQNPCWNNANTFPEPWNFQLLSWLENAPEFLTEPNMWYLDPYSKQLSYINTDASTPTDAVLPVIESLVVVQGERNQAVSNITFKNLSFAYATWLGPNSQDGYAADQSGNFLRGNNYAANLIGHQKVVYSTPGNIQLSYANNIIFSGNTFTHLGGVALELGVGSKDNQIIGNTFNDISSAAIQIGGVSLNDMRANEADQVSRNLIKNNLAT